MTTAALSGTRSLPAVLAGWSGSGHSTAAVRWAARQAVRHGYALVVVRVDPPTPATQRSSWGLVSGTGAGFLLGDAGAERLRAELIASHPDLDVRFVRCDGDPATILAAATQWAELVVLGARGPARVANRVVGPVVAEVLRVSTGPVAVVPGLHVESGDGAITIASRCLETWWPDWFSTLLDDVHVVADATAELVRASWDSALVVTACAGRHHAAAAQCECVALVRSTVCPVLRLPVRVLATPQASWSAGADVAASADWARVISSAVR
ncbi:MAG: universal stress protein [Candidatus Phosphoribacter sp.]|nr:universal stress protein [Actinomycetales bacterium]